MFKLFLNYLSIVEICIDKGLSGGDLCSCQLSQRKVPLGHRPDRSACKTQPRALFVWPAMTVRMRVRLKGVSRLRSSRLLHRVESIGLAGLWPEGEQAAGPSLLLSPSIMLWDLTLSMTHSGLRVTLTRLQTDQIHNKNLNPTLALSRI